MVRRYHAALHTAGVVVAMTSLAAPSFLSPAVANGAPTGCPDVELVFARGTFEPSGLGRFGEALASSLRSRLPGRTVASYAVQYPASLDFGRAADGVADATRYMHRGAPPLAFGAPYVVKTLDLCAPGDPICHPGGFDRAAHSSYAVNGMVDRAADFVARRVDPESRSAENPRGSTAVNPR